MRRRRAPGGRRRRWAPGARRVRPTPRRRPRPPSGCALDPGQAAALERWLRRVATDHAERVLPVDGPVAEVWGRLTAKRPGSVIDTLMAATTLAHGLVLVTRNLKDVAWTGVSYLNPFDAAR